MALGATAESMAMITGVNKPHMANNVLTLEDTATGERVPAASERGKALIASACKFVAVRCLPALATPAPPAPPNAPLTWRQ